MNFKNLNEERCVNGMYSIIGGFLGCFSCDCEGIGSKICGSVGSYGLTMEDWSSVVAWVGCSEGESLK